jgi:hypothetical protein
LVIEPRPVKPALPAPDPAQQIAARAITTHAIVPTVADDPGLEPQDGSTQADILLEAIVQVAREPGKFTG